MRFMIMLGRLTAIVVVFTGLAMQSKADYLYDNLIQPAYEGDSLSSDVFQAASFSTGSATTLTTVNLLLGLNGKSATGSFTISLLADNATSPGNVLTTLAIVNDSSLNADLGVFTLPTDYLLNAQTRYWIELKDTGGSSSYWGWAQSDTGLHVATEYFQNGNSKGVQPNSQGPYIMQVATPEPASLALLGFGTPCLLALARVRRMISQ